MKTAILNLRYEDRVVKFGQLKESILNIKNKRFLKIRIVSLLGTCQIDLSQSHRNNGAQLKWIKHCTE